MLLQRCIEQKTVQCCGTTQQQPMIHAQGGTHLYFPGYPWRLWPLQGMHHAHDEVTVLHSIVISQRLRWQAVGHRQHHSVFFCSGRGGSCAVLEWRKPGAHGLPCVPVGPAGPANPNER